MSVKSIEPLQIQASINNTWAYINTLTKPGKACQSFDQIQSSQVNQAAEAFHFPKASWSITFVNGQTLQALYGSARKQAHDKNLQKIPEESLLVSTEELQYTACS